MAYGDKLSIWFWQRMVTPHMAELADEMARCGCEVTYVAEQMMSEERSEQGWTPPELADASLKLVSTEASVATLIDAAPEDTIHICQGIRSNGLVGVAQRRIANAGLRQWIIMETVEDSGWKGVLRRIAYSRLFSIWNSKVDAVLAIGEKTSKWVADRGMPVEKIAPFSYFLPKQGGHSNEPKSNRIRFIFVGRLIPLKRIDLLMYALKSLLPQDFELVIVGSGEQEAELKVLSNKVLPDRVNWIGRVPLDQVAQHVANADCLVLPSIHDGWGAVVSEALLVGTPAVCSDQCGASIVVKASGYGGVFRSGDKANLAGELQKVIDRKSLSDTDRQALSSWAESLSTHAGATYLISILNWAYSGAEKPGVPWGSSHVG